jgi:hypothetical protein
MKLKKQTIIMKLKKTNNNNEIEKNKQ